MANSNYSAEAIEVLQGLEPVRKRPGMYTDTARPNHLAQEVIDNAVDEALAGYCKNLSVTLHADGSLEVSDDGRGMPVDLHPVHKVTGVELILTKLHSGAKFSNKQYQFSGGLHGVGVSVVNALSTRLEVRVCRDGTEYQIGFAGGEVVDKLKPIGNVAKNRRGTTVHFWPDAKYFDSPKFSLPRLKQVLRAKAVLCPNLKVTLTEAASGEVTVWQYENGLRDYLRDALGDAETLPAEPFIGNFKGTREEAEWALVWLNTEGRRAEPVAESYVNLIPTAQGGTHVNGLRTGLTEAIREFCEFRNLLPRGLKLAPEDVWQDCAYVLSVKMQDPQFGLASLSRALALAMTSCAICSPASGCWLSHRLNESWTTPDTKVADPSRSCARRSRPARPCRASSPTACRATSRAPSCSSSKAIPPVAAPSRRATANSRRSCRCAARS